MRACVCVSSSLSKTVTDFDTVFCVQYQFDLKSWSTLFFKMPTNMAAIFKMADGQKFKSPDFKNSFFKQCPLNLEINIINFIFQNGHQYGRYFQNGHQSKRKSSDLSGSFLKSVFSTWRLSFLSLFFKIAENMAAIYRMVHGP